MPSREAVVSYDCEECGRGATATFGEMVFDGRLRWSLSHLCRTGPVEACGHDDSPAGPRRALLDQCGTYHLRLRAGDRVAAMRVLRDRGVPLPDLPAMVARLRDAGLPGTEMELRALAAHLTAAGATVVLEPPSPRR